MRKILEREKINFGVIFSNCRFLIAFLAEFFAQTIFA
jgi:hypothetical protein